MARRDRDAVNREIRTLKDSLERLEQELRDTPTLPEEPEKGSVIKFSVQFKAGGAVYTYVAYRFGTFGSRWRVTDAASPTCTWEDVVALMRKDHAVSLGHHHLTWQYAVGWRTFLDD